jgi:hypothetical protein
MEVACTTICSWKYSLDMPLTNKGGLGPAIGLKEDDTEGQWEAIKPYLMGIFIISRRSLSRVSNEARKPSSH